MSNLGGELLYLPVNSLLFFILSYYLLYSLLSYDFGLPVFVTHKLSAVLVALLFLFSVALLAGVHEPLEWVLRIGYLMFGFLLLFVLLQEPISRLHNYVSILICFLVVHALVGLVQILISAEESSVIPLNLQAVPVGIFQQVNVQASLMVTAIVLAIYSLICLHANSLVRWFSFVLIALASLVLFASGSRVGLLGLLFVLPMILLANWSSIRQQKNTFFVILLAFFMGSAAGVTLSDGFYHAHSKLERLAEGGQDLRPVIYRVSWDIFKESPIHGHGIGSFSPVFHEKVALYQAELGGIDIIGSARYSHPHNELLFWAVEGGVLAVFGLLLFAVTVFYALLQQRFRKGLTFFALIFPIALHTMVELPFYTSVYHWFIFVFLLALLFKQTAYPIHFNISQSMQMLIKGSVGLVLVVSMVFFAGSFYISQQLPRIIYQGKGSLEQLYSFRKHPYFTDFAVRMTYANLVLHERDEGEVEINRQYAEWMENYLQRVPDINVFIELIRVYDYLSEVEKLKAASERALYLYPEHKGINAVVDELSLRNLP